MTASWLLIQKSSHGKLLGIPAVRWAVSLALTLVVFLILRVLVTAARSRLKARSGLTEPGLNDYLLHLLERTWTLSLLAGSAFAALDFVELRAAEGAGGFSVAVHLVERVLTDPGPAGAFLLTGIPVQASGHLRVVVWVLGQRPPTGGRGLGLERLDPGRLAGRLRLGLGLVLAGARRPEGLRLKSESQQPAAQEPSRFPPQSACQSRWPRGAGSPPKGPEGHRSPAGARHTSVARPAQVWYSSSQTLDLPHRSGVSGPGGSSPKTSVIYYANVKQQS